jgi:hypothetical protein
LDLHTHLSRKISDVFCNDVPFFCSNQVFGLVPEESEVCVDQLMRLFYLSGDDKDCLYPVLPKLGKKFKTGDRANDNFIEEAPETENMSGIGVAEFDYEKDGHLIKSESGKFRKAKVQIYECDQNPNDCHSLGIRQVPTVRLYRGSKLIDERIGACRLSILLPWVINAIADWERNQAVTP